MHHIEHVRKKLYRLINPKDFVLKIQFLPNRRQVPLCVSFHDKVYDGTYQGESLKSLFKKQKNF